MMKCLGLYFCLCIPSLPYKDAFGLFFTMRTRYFPSQVIPLFWSVHVFAELVPFED